MLAKEDGKIWEEMEVSLTNMIITKCTNGSTFTQVLNIILIIIQSTSSFSISLSILYHNITFLIIVLKCL